MLRASLELLSNELAELARLGESQIALLVLIFPPPGRAQRTLRSPPPPRMTGPCSGRSMSAICRPRYASSSISRSITFVKIGVSSYDHPLLDTQFTQLSVQLAMIQLYILFMVTPIFFLLAQVDRHAIEAARDLGGNWWGTFREVILPQTMPSLGVSSSAVGSSCRRPCRGS